MEDNGGWGEYPMPETPMAEISETKEGYLCRSDMTLRDYFAGQALVGLLSNPRVLLDETLKPNIGLDCYEIADAMLGARK